MDPLRRTYLVVSATDWLLVAILGIVAVRWFGIPWWFPVAVLAVWIVKDLLAFPAMRWYYEPQPAEARIIGQRGEALSALEPEGFVRVNGEIWQAQVLHESQKIAQGQSIRVRGAEGLRLFVEPLRTGEPSGATRS